MPKLNDAQVATGRRQLELERELIASGMDPVEAQRVAAEEVLGLPAERRQRAALGRARAEAPPVSYGNAATLDNLDGAATELVVEDILGGALSRPAVPQSERVFQDDPTMGMAGMVAAREQAAAEDWERRGEIYGPQTEAYVEKYGRTWGPDAPPLTGRQQQARLDRQGAADVARHNPRAEESRIRRMADRAGISYAEAEAMVNQGYQDAGAVRGMREDSRFVVGGANGTPPPTSDYFSDAYKPLRNVIGDRRAEDKRARQEALVRRRMAQTNPLEYMNRDDISDWNRMVAADGMLRRGYRGATPLDVEQAAETAKALQQQRMALGQGFQQTPEQKELLALQIEQKRRELQTPQERAASDVAAGRGPFAGGITARANEIVNNLYSRDVMGVPSTLFTADEVELAAQRLHQETGLPLEEARQVMARIREERHGTGWLSGLSWM